MLTLIFGFFFRSPVWGVIRHNPILWLEVEKEICRQLFRCFFFVEINIWWKDFLCKHIPTCSFRHVLCHKAVLKWIKISLIFISSGHFQTIVNALWYFSYLCHCMFSFVLCHKHVYMFNDNKMNLNLLMAYCKWPNTEGSDDPASYPYNKTINRQVGLPWTWSFRILVQTVEKVPIKFERSEYK